MTDEDTEVSEGWVTDRGLGSLCGELLLGEPPQGLRERWAGWPQAQSLSHSLLAVTATERTQPGAPGLAAQQSRAGLGPISQSLGPEDVDA